MNPVFILNEKTLLDGTHRQAIYSPCMQYRYQLRASWSSPEIEDEPNDLCFIMLNPSTATEEKNDPTIERVERRARAGGYDGFVILNIFAYRATDPLNMKKFPEPIGPSNDWFLEDALMSERNIICGWGCHGIHQNRNKEILDLFKKHDRTPLALSWTSKGHPKHPLYINYGAKPHEKKE